MRSNIEARDSEIYKLRMLGETFKSIGNTYNITSNRVRQIFLKIKERKEHE